MSNEETIVVLNNKKTSPEQELVQDMLAIIHVFSSRLYGLRKYKKQLQSLSNDLKQKSKETAAKVE